MVYFYDCKEDVPEDVECVDDNVEYFNKVTLHKLTSDVNKLLRHTDKCTYQDTQYYKDQFEHSLPWYTLSTGGMTVLNVYYNPGVAFNGIDCGLNALSDAALLPEGIVYGAAPWGDENTKFNVCYAGKKYTSFKEYVDD